MDTFFTYRILPKLRLDGDCWIWVGCTNGQAYGVTRFRGKLRLLHRIVYELLRPDDPLQEGLVIRHQCHNRACCNPAHLIQGTPKENTMDYYAMNPPR